MTEEPGVAWAGRALDRPVTEVTPLAGGMTSRMLRLGHGRGDYSVLRLITEEPWIRHGAELARRESSTQRLLAHLMSWLVGEPDAMREDEAAVRVMAELAGSIHDVRSEPMPRTFQSWA